MLRRSLFVGLALVSVLALAAVGFGAWVLASESGTVWLVERLAARAPDGFGIDAVRGTLLGEVEITGLRYRSATEDVAVERAAVSLDLKALLGGALVIEDLVVSTIEYRALAGPGSEPGPTSMPALPLDIVLESAVIGELRIAREPEPLVFARITLGASYLDERLDVARLETRFRDFALSGYGALGLGEAITADGTLSWSGRFRGEIVLGSIAFRGTLADLGIELELLEPFAATGEGRVGLAPAPSFDVALEWRDLAVPGFDPASSPRGTAQLRGTPEQLQFAMSGALEVEGRAVDVETDGGLADGILSFERLGLLLGNARADASGSLDLATLAFDAEISARGLDPTLLAAGYPGRIDADGRLRGRLGADFEVATDAFSLSGEIREYPFDARVAGRLRGLDSGEIELFELALGPNRLRATGSVGATLALEVDGELVDLAALYPGIGGVARIEVDIGGTRTLPLIAGRVEIEDLAYGSYGAERATLEGRLGIEAGTQIQLAATAAGIRLDRLEASSLSADVSGSLDAHTLNLALRADQWSAGFDASGGFTDRVWRGSVSTLNLQQALLGEWALAAPSAMTLAAGRVELDESCLVNANGRVCTRVRFRGEPSDRLALEASDFAIETLQPFLPETLVLSGVYGLEAELNDPTGSPNGFLALRGGETEVMLDMGGGDAVTTTIDQVGVDAELADWRLDLGVSLDGRDTGRIDLAVTADDIRDRGAPIAGRLDAFWPDPGVVSLLSPDVGAVTGAVTATLGLGGTADAPELEGSAAWRGGSIEIPAWGVTIDGIEAEATSADGTAVDFRGTGLVEGSELSLAGRTDLDAARGWPTRLRVTGDRVRLLQVAEAEAFASPDLVVDVALPEITVTGTVLIPEATISLDQLPDQAVSPSADSVIHGMAEAGESVRPLQVRADIRLMLGDEVRYTGSNLQSRLTGDLALQYASGRPTNAQGTLNIAGAYVAYGQSLELDRGELLFAGPLENPNLDVRAVRRIGETTVGVQLNGSLQAPETRIFSEPAMSEADALSYLLFGRPLSSSEEANENATLQSAALAMGLQQALPVVERIGDSLGLDEFSIETTDVDAGALMAGKYLSPKLYVRYSYGLFNRIGGILLRFRINDRLSLETRSGDEKSMDLLYTVEKE